MRAVKVTSLDVDTPITSGDLAAMAAGDTLDLGGDGVIVWLEGDDAVAFRLVVAKRQREIQRILALRDGVAGPLYRSDLGQIET